MKTRGTDIDSKEDDDVTSDIYADVSGDFWSEDDNACDADSFQSEKELCTSTSTTQHLLMQQFSRSQRLGFLSNGLKMT